MIERNKFYQGNSKAVLETFPDNCVDCIVTSPPYWSLRDYGTGTWEGGNESCDHLKCIDIVKKANGSSTIEGCTTSQMQTAIAANTFTDVCGKCGAVRIDEQLGMEKSPDEYVSHLLEILGQSKRVLKKQGTLWLNLGDSYAGSGKAQGQKADSTNMGVRLGDRPADVKTWTTVPVGLKSKDMVGIPWRMAFALQGFAVVPFYSFSEWANLLAEARSMQDWTLVEFVEGLMRKMDLLTQIQSAGWYLRSDIIWSKPNPMPESVSDRCTKSHEYIFMLTKGPTYYYDAEAIKTESLDPIDDRGSRDGQKRRPTQLIAGIRNSGIYPKSNKRTVWTVTTKPFAEAHFATFPPDLIVDCIKAGSSEHGCCSGCGAPWERIVESKKSFVSGSGKSGNEIHGKNGKDLQGGGTTGDIRKGPVLTTTTTGWEPTCECNGKFVEEIVQLEKENAYGDMQEAITTYYSDIPLTEHPIIPALVLDPFSGAGTTAMVAKKIRRDFVGVELNQKYIDISERRFRKEFGLFNVESQAVK